MRHLAWILALGLLTSAVPAAAGAPGAAGEEPTAVEPLSFEEDDTDELNAWFQARVDKAAAGVRERVRVPLVYRSAGWGCKCPETFPGTSPDMHPGSIWLDLEYADDVEAPTVDPIVGLVVWAEGHFTGAHRELDLRDGEDEPEEWRYDTVVFVVERLEPWDADADDRDQVTVLP